jgi:NitT/TauT family transport system ATP-binding protein
MPPSSPVMLSLQEVEVEFLNAAGERVRLLDQVTLEIREDEVVAILGASGSGLSSLVRVAAGLARPSSGQVTYRQEPAAGPLPQVGVVFQSPALFPWLTVEQNIQMGLERANLPPGRQKEQTAWAVDRVGVDGYEEAYPRELSSGMKQRVALARALAGQPELLVLDDPFSSLDVLAAEALRGEVLALWQNADVNPKSILLATHHILEAVLLASRIVLLSGHPTKVKAVIDNPLPYPRDPNGVEFQDKVTQVHDALTADVLPDDVSPAQAGRFATRMAPLPKAEIAHVFGLLEALAAQGGRFDVFDYVAETHQGYGQVLLAVNAAEMLDYVRTPKDKVEITEAGRRILGMDINARKALLNVQLQGLKLVTLLVDMIQRSPERGVTREMVLETLALQLPGENPTQQFHTLVAWTRYAELMGYSARRGLLYLDRLFVSEGGQIREQPVLKPLARRQVAGVETTAASPAPEAPPTDQEPGPGGPA